eukprot:CAMPEP_0183327360 /NCGR_PEP_ID=MMETSP0160_2-20130417/83723_1 /TAXON_ID=2839 ORGANISM="Odontella Sinensis, Strain Grunow 1884" /NCGR_SAMPLE_ID=MMETSP0160_2 /ASSEMBLY_ACC=CAM_ASM_000250 /LENGTH=311 /DNA_ID=CAMNT_0025495485 /DNA_START=495 /DNA_END=1430 /DNA_ORIENTATION=-
MSSRDGHRMVLSQNDRSEVRQYVPCSRWEEIKECVDYHADMSALLNAPTVFRLLNDPGRTVGPQEFSVADQGAEFSACDCERAKSVMSKATPCGLTPLTEHIVEIRARISALAPSLTREGRKAVVVLATDGLPTGGRDKVESSKQFVQALRTLEGLPVWIVIRLCTDEDDVVEYYNDLDEQLELSLEVLYGFVAEAKEVFECNRWLNYALPLHRMRELGFHDRVFDLIDERALTKSELRQFCLLLFGDTHFDGVPDPSVDWLGFLNELERVVANSGKVWDPLKKRVLPWIDTRELDQIYGDYECVPGCSIL